MEQDPIAVRVAEIVCTELELDPVKISTEFSAATNEEWDSLGQLRICLAIEREYRIDLEMEDIRRLMSVSSLVEHIKFVQRDGIEK